MEAMAAVKMGDAVKIVGIKGPMRSDSVGIVLARSGLPGRNEAWRVLIEGEVREYHPVYMELVT